MLIDKKIKANQNFSSRRFCVAPMMEYTDKHCRYFFRNLTQKAFLYTEMVTSSALMFGERYDLLDYNKQENPLALQLGGSCPNELAKCAVMAQERGYNEVNLNIGCPSARVQSGAIGACLMAQPTLVAECVKTMKAAVDIPVTVKHRIGIQKRKSDNPTSYNNLTRFVEMLANVGCDSFIIHARVAILEGLNPKENRVIPQLDYLTVYRIKENFPELEIILNGGIKNIKDAKEHLNYVDGVMMGREAYKNPFILKDIDSIIYGIDSKKFLTRYNVACAMIPYIKKQLNSGVRLHQVTRHMLGLFKGESNSRKYKQLLSTASNKQYNVEYFIDILEQCINR